MITVREVFLTAVIGVPLVFSIIATRLKYGGWPPSFAGRSAARYLLLSFLGTSPLFLFHVTIGPVLDVVLAWLYASFALSQVAVAVARARVPHAAEGRKRSSVFDVGYETAFVILTFAVGYMQVGLKDTATGAIISGPADALYFSMITLTTLGYGDIVPVGAARPLAMFEGLAGYTLIVVSVAVLLRDLGHSTHSTPSR